MADGTALYIARTALDANQVAIEVAANNAANAQSIAYKGRMLITTDNFYTTLKRSGLPDASSGFSSPIMMQRGSGTKVAGIVKIMSQGAKKQTDDPFHMMINGGGYFPIKIPGEKGVGYSRVGAFRVSKDGKLVTVDAGYELDGGITIPQNVNQENINISNTGLITNRDTGETYGQIEIATFPNEGGLEDIGGGIALVTDASGEAIRAVPNSDPSFGTIVQGALEATNISIIESLTSVIAFQRNSELNMKVIEAVNSLMQKTIESAKMS